jgi:dihydroorotate dehydrogenase electron transfer subunit
MLAAVAQVCADNHVPSQVAVEELMACGYGVCMTCVLPVHAPQNERQPDEVVYERACTQGPVFDGASVVWNAAVGGISLDQSELVPAGSPVRQRPQPAGAEHAPPGN